MSNRLQQIIDRYESREEELEAEAKELREKLDALEKRIEEAKVMRKDAQHLLQARGKDSGESASSSKTSTAKKTQSASSSSASGPDDKTIHEMGIVDAAIALAERHNQKIADAGQVLSWFEDINYETRSGLPSRNSVYVSLNRESKGDSKRIERHDRGQFRFNFS
jgi:chromosome segregation ATPase